ncbi:MAG: MerR family transcriptional regulator [Micrococcales bacterium]|nr:MerR family transcriptional regulator [Micrococcales bacterium]
MVRGPGAAAGSSSPPGGTMSIGEVLEALRDQFPALSISKLRYLEVQGLLHPARTPSGYRRYGAMDVERARYILTEQRDHFLPLKVIKVRLAAMDRDGTAAVKLGQPRRVRSAQVDQSEVATITGQDPNLVAAVAKAAGIDDPEQANAALIQAVEAVVALANHGLELRHLRGVFQSASRQAELIERAVGAQHSRGSAGRERATAAAIEAAADMAKLSEAAVRLHLGDS